MKPTCGVALCTYNGQEYLQEQLESIVNQSRLPDAIVICDDRSTDQTWEILKAFEATSPIPVTIARNDAQRGIIRNFERAVSMLQTDLIFLCDQDDIWLPDKVAGLSSVLAGAPETLLVFTDALLIDGTGRELGMTLFDGLQLDPWEKKALAGGNGFEVFCRRNLVTGATAAFRRSLLSTAMPFPDVCLHDEWLALIASAKGKVTRLPTPTIKYRQHEKNVVGVRKSGRLQKLKQLWWSTRKPGSRKFTADRIRLRATLTERLNALPGVPFPVISQSRESLAFAQFRAALPQPFLLRLPMVAWRAAKGQYRKFGHHWKSDVFRDLIHK